jgi:hypothetical protein
MGSPNSRNVAAAKPKVGGGVYRAPLGTVLPTDGSETLPAEAVALGYISDAGLTPTRDTSVDKVKAWGGDIVAALLTDESRSFEFTLLEVYSADVQKFVHGEDNVTVTPAAGAEGTKIAVTDKGGKPDQQVLIFEMRHGLKTRRVIVPVADPTITGEEPWTDGGLSAYTVTVEAIKDASGTRVYEYFENDDAPGA